ncbi:MAG: biopolymer transporter ExbD [Bdellovibrio sp.]|nr:MAG: biopolymer transporter ExbD [Bdellovibrio sp.]
MKNGMKQALPSPLLESSPLASQKPEKRFSLDLTALTLTPLVDAFSILVIYLLVNTSMDATPFQIEKGVRLPLATHTQAMKEGVVLKIKKGVYFIDDHKISARRLVQVLKKKKAEKQARLIVQADKKSSFRVISPVMIAGSVAGYDTVKFAVIQDGERK